jgi:RNA polymerase sigma factor (sigma-70 family)
MAEEAASNHELPPAPAATSSEKDWADVVERIRRGDQSALEELYAYFGKGVRYFLLRRLGNDELEDRVHDVFLVVAEAIRNGELRDPSRLMGYIRTVVRRTIAGVIQGNVNARVNYMDLDNGIFSMADWRMDPERKAVENERAELVRRLLKGVSKRDREVLRRFYVEEQTQDQICEEMRLTYNQFRLLKSRAKARFSEMGRRVAERMGLAGSAD